MESQRLIEVSKQLFCFRKETRRPRQTTLDVGRGGGQTRQKYTHGCGSGGVSETERQTQRNYRPQ